METRFIKPAEGRRVLLENGRALAAEGATVPHDLFARRLISDGDVDVVADAAPEPAAPEPVTPQPAAPPTPGADALRESSKPAAKVAAPAPEKAAGA